MASGIVPIVSFAPFLNGNEEQRAEVAQQVYQAFHDVGFLYLKDFGISAEKVDSIFELSSKFFALPYELKARYALSDPSVNQGYTGDGAEGVGDHKECYEHRRFRNDLCPTTEEMSAQSPVLANFKDELNSFYGECLTLSLHVLKCLAIAMKLPGGDGYFDSITKSADPQLRLLHYPPIAASKIYKAGSTASTAGEEGRIMPHTDFGLCTLLFQDQVGGLEIDPFHTGEFIPCKPIQGTVLINIGDLLRRLLNGRVRSTLHRVVSPAGNLDGNTMLPARYSIPFFVHPDPDAMIDPIVPEGEEKLYTAVNAGEWRDFNTAKNYGMKEHEKILASKVGIVAN